MTGNGTGDVAALREEIRRTRVELAETVELLAARADPKTLLRHGAEQAKDHLRAQATQTAARVRGQATQTAARVRGQAASKARQVRARAYEKGGAVGRGPLPWAAVAAGALATAMVLLIVRGRRR